MRNLSILLFVFVAARYALGCSSGETDTTWIEAPTDAGVDAPELPPELETGDASTATP
jgi:hypothetical protein